LRLRLAFVLWFAFGRGYGLAFGRGYGLALGVSVMVKG